MTLKDTIPLMLSDDWKDRLKAEYWQTTIRLERLSTFLSDVETKGKPLHSKTPLSYYGAQAALMDGYLQTLRMRAYREHINLYSDE